jgi:carbamoyl-phosphate synthase large subunit
VGDASRRIIERERPDAVLPTMGGQTALNCALELEKRGVLKEFGVQLIGASVAAIEKAEDRGLFAQAMAKIGLEMPRAVFCTDVEAALRAAEVVGFPAIVRPSFTLGGTGGGIARDAAQLAAIAGRGLAASPIGQILVEQSVLGWKEFEMEVVRDRADNCIIVCSIENLDPMGVHTGDPGGRGGHRRGERAVRSRPGDGAHGGDRDESTGVTQLGAGVEGDGVPDRKGGGEVGGGVHAR